MTAAIVDAAKPCEHCGFDGRRVSPSDAAVTGRSLARRWSELFEAVARAEDEGEALLHQRLPSGLTAAEHVAHVADVFASTASSLERVWELDCPALKQIAARPAREGSKAALSRLADAADQLAAMCGRYGGGDLSRIGTGPDGAVTARELLAAAIHEGVHHALVSSRVDQPVRLPAA